MTTVNKIEILESGVVQIRLNKTARPGHEPNRDCWGHHRIAAEPGADMDQWRTLVNEHFEAMGVNEISVDEWAKVKSYAALAHTDEAIAAYAEMRQSEG